MSGSWSLRTTRRPLLPKSLAEGITEQRRRLGLGKAALARSIGVTEQTVYEWERKGTQPQRRHLAALCVLFELSYWERQFWHYLAGHPIDDAFLTRCVECFAVWVVGQGQNKDLLIACEDYDEATMAMKDEYEPA